MPGVKRGRGCGAAHYPEQLQPPGCASAGHTQGMLDLVAQIADLIIVKHDALLGQFAAIMLQAVGKGQTKKGKQTDAQKKRTRTTSQAPKTQAVSFAADALLSC